jgi:pimeloyl-ACP methyl ester carboxylesterase
VPAPVKRAQLCIEGVATPYLEAGEGTTAAVFVHGNPGAGEDWRALVAEVGGFMRAVAPDLPGFGGAAKPATFNYTLSGYAQHLHALLDALQITRVHLVLHDFGGPWGLWWAALNPTRVASVTLINTGVFPGYRWHFMARLWRTPRLGELIMAITTRFGFRLLLGLGNPRGLPPEFVERMYRDFDAGTRRAVLKLYRATSDIEGYSQHVSAALRPFNLPALVIWGRADIYLPATLAQRQCETFARAQVVMLDDSGHFPYADNPTAVAALLIAFLQQQLAS